MFLIFFFCWYIKRKISFQGILPEFRKEVYNLIAEIDTVTDRDLNLVEERIKTLKKLIEDTDQRITAYKRELQQDKKG
jgi:hypothetical protein